MGDEKVRRGRKRGLVAAVVAIAVVGAAFASSVSVAGAAKQASGPQGAVTLDYDFAFQGGMNFDPAKSTTGLNAYLQHLVLGGLFWNNQDSSVRADLASGYTLVSPTVLEVTLRPNLTFTDGSPLTATEVKASIERTALSPTGISSIVKYPANFPGGNLTSIDIVNPTKLRFTLNAPYAGQLVLVLAQLPGVIVNAKQFNDASLKNTPIGAGAYKVVSNDGQSLKLTASDSYWDAKKTKIKDVTFLQNANTGTGPTQGINRITTGEFDYYNAYFADTASVLAAAKGNVKTIVTPSDVQYTWFNICKQPYKSLTAQDVAGLADQNVRTAMNLMVDRDGLNKSLFAGKSAPRTQNWLKGSPFYDAKAAKVFTYDPKKAKEFMAKSAFPNGFEFTVVNNSTPLTDRIAQYLQQQWAQLGIKVNILTSLSITNDWFLQLKGPAAMTNFIGIQSFKLSNTYDSQDGRNNACGWANQQQFVNDLKGAAPDALKTLKATWQGSAEKVASDQSEIMLVWSLNQALYNSSKISKVVITLDGLGREQFDPTRSTTK